MTRSEPTPSTPPSTFAIAENASRRVLLIICLGVLSWGVGSVLSVNLHEALEGPLDAIETGLGAIIEHWAFQRVWVLFVLAPVCWLAGRFIGGLSVLFVVPAFFSGEALSFALAFLQDGSPFHSWEDVAGWAVSVVVALPPCFLAFASGAKAFGRAQERSLVDAASRKAEYDAFIAKATGPEAPPPAPATAPPSEAGPSNASAAVPTEAAPPVTPVAGPTETTTAPSDGTPGSNAPKS